MGSRRGPCCLHRTMCHGMEWRIVWDVYSTTAECRGRPGSWGHQEEGWPKEGRGCFFPSLSFFTWLAIPTQGQTWDGWKQAHCSAEGTAEGGGGEEGKPCYSPLYLAGCILQHWRAEHCGTGSRAQHSTTGMYHDTVGAQGTWVGPWATLIHQCREHLGPHPAVPSPSQAYAGAKLTLQLVVRCQPSNSSLGNQGSS